MSNWLLSGQGQRGDSGQIQYDGLAQEDWVSAGTEERAKKSQRDVWESCRWTGLTCGRPQMRTEALPERVPVGV